MPNFMPGTETIGGQGLGRVKTALFRYSFATEGGAVGDITLRGDAVPSGAVVLDALILVDTALTSGGSATVALKLQSAADINAADAFDGSPWSTAGAKRVDFDADTVPLLLTANRTLAATVATAALTAGAFRVVVFYVEVAA